MSAIDSGVSSTPASRPSTFTPSIGYVAVPAANDYGVNTTVAVRPKCFEPPSWVAQIDPGLTANG
jgi:hypothetical protein